MFKTISPYIQMLQKFSIEWLPFSEEILKEANINDKMIFIHIGNIVNRANRTAAQSLFSDPQIADILNENFYPIVVDTEEYPEAHLLGWEMLLLNSEDGNKPINLFLMPDFTPITSTSSCSPEEIHMLLENLLYAFNQEREALSGMGEEAKQYLINSSIKNVNKNQINDDFDIKKMMSLSLSQFAEHLSIKLINFDNYFKKSPFTLRTPTLLFLVEYVEKYPNQIIFDFLNKTAKKITNSTMYDPVDGGFFFEMKNSNLDTPFCEKKLYDNLQLALFMAKWYRLTNEIQYRWISEDVIRFIDNTMKNETAFITALSLDSEKESEEYYKFSLQEIERAFGKRKNVIAASLGMDLLSDPDQKQFLSNTKARMSLSEEDVEKLHIIRQSHKGLIKDSREVTAYNSLYINILCSLYLLLNKKEYLNEAIKLHQILLSKAFNENGELCRYCSNGIGTIQVQSDLSDYAEFTASNITLYHCTKDNYYQQETKKMLDHILKYYINKDNTMFYKTKIYDYIIPFHRESVIDGIKASTNSIMCSNLIEYAIVTGDYSYKEMVTKQLLNILPDLPNSGPYLANWARQIIKYVELPD